MRSGEKYSTLGVADHLYSEPDPDPFFYQDLSIGSIKKI